MVPVSHSLSFHSADDLTIDWNEDIMVGVMHGSSQGLWFSVVIWYQVIIPIFFRIAGQTFLMIMDESRMVKNWYFCSFSLHLLYCALLCHLLGAKVRYDVDIHINLNGCLMKYTIRNHYITIVLLTCPLSCANYNFPLHIFFSEAMTNNTKKNYILNIGNLNIS